MNVFGSDVDYADQHIPEIRVLTDKRVVARKAHTCDDCGGEIAPGARYHLTAVFEDGVFTTHKGCLRYACRSHGRGLDELPADLPYV